MTIPGEHIGSGDTVGDGKLCPVLSDVGARAESSPDEASCSVKANTDEACFAVGDDIGDLARTSGGEDEDGEDVGAPLSACGERAVEDGGDEDDEEEDVVDDDEDPFELR